MNSKFAPSPLLRSEATSAWNRNEALAKTKSGSDNAKGWVTAESGRNKGAPITSTFRVEIFDILLISLCC